MKEIIVRSWNELQEKLFEDSWNESIGRFRSPFVFRGLSNSGYKLNTTLSRLGSNFVSMEHHLIRNFKKYAHNNIVEKDSIWHWLSIAQHHGLPTRLLDWTFSPFVAMHFATAKIERFNLDGVIWMVDFVKAHELLPVELRKALNEEGAAGLTTEILSEIIPSLQDFDSLSDKPFVIFFDPPSMDERIINQYALFSVMSDPKINLCSWLENYPKLVKKIIIPSKLKWEIRDKLDQANITERVLFPGLDGLSLWLKRHYCSFPDKF